MSKIPGFSRYLPSAVLCLMAAVAQGQTIPRPPANSIARLDSTCFTMRSASECERIAKTIAHDIPGILWLGGELEQQQRFAEAHVAYRAGLRIYPNHRELLQGLIRARQGERSASLLSTTQSAGTVQPTFAKAEPLGAGFEPTAATSVTRTSMQPRPADTPAPRPTPPISILSPGPKPATSQ